MSSLAGRTLSHYRILDEISRGGMGVVYRAVDTRLNREIALKVLPPELVSDPDRRQRFIQEAQAASAIEHPNIAVIHEIDEVDGVSFIAMELIRGDKMDDVLGQGPMPAARALELATEVAEGLARAHETGIVHRDLKPANVMVTVDGHAKIIDFGLAKLIEPLSGDLTGATYLAGRTDPGVVLGTVAYMSPEQARAAKVDHRSDIFSFGILLYQMLTGRLPFRAASGLDTLHAILNADPPPIGPLGAHVSAEATADIQRLLDKCLAKDPASRYQGMRDLVVDLRAARRRLESGPIGRVGRVGQEGRASRVGSGIAQRVSLSWMIGAAVIVVAVIVAAAMLMRTGRSEVALAPGEKPSVAVLYFENNTGNPSLDWLRTGLTDMVVTDLSQSPDVEVLGTDRLYQILNEMRRADDRVISFDTVQEVAKRAGVKTVLLGSYVKAGDTIRINIKLQEAASGRIITAERVEAAGEHNLFPTVDDLTRRIKSKFLPGGAGAVTGLLSSPVTVSTTTPGVDRDLRDVTTASIEAYRYYAEGINLHERFREQEAVPLLEKALEIDPGFAMAMAKLSIIEGNLGHANKSEEYIQRAFEHVDRVSARERFYVEGIYYSRRAETYQRAIDSYQKAIEQYPDHASARHNLALLYSNLGRYEESIPLYEELRRRGMVFPVTYSNLANNYLRLGQFDKAQEILQEYVRRNPDNARAHRSLGDVLAESGRPDEAMAAYDKSKALDPANLAPDERRRALFIVADRWADVEAIDRMLRDSNDPNWKINGNLGLAVNALYRGRTAGALRFFDAAVAVDGSRGSTRSAGARNNAAALELERNRPAVALSLAQRALEDARGVGSAPFFSHGLIARAQARLGRRTDADEAVEEMQQMLNQLPDRRFTERAMHIQTGGMALERGDHGRAVQDLTRAEATLPRNPGGGGIGLWFLLGSAHLAAGNDAEARTRFEKIVNAGIHRTASPLEFVRSLYFLGQIAERQGDRERARGYYRRFVGYWGDGDIDRDRVADARRKLN